MLYEIHVFKGVLTITVVSSGNYKIGDSHAFLLYLREQSDSEFDFDKAEDIVNQSGKGEISKAGKVNPNRVKNSDNKKYYEEALANGSALVIYSKPL